MSSNGIDLACNMYGISKEAFISTILKNKALNKSLSPSVRQNLFANRTANPSNFKPTSLVDKTMNYFSNMDENKKHTLAAGALGLGAGYLYGNQNNGG